MYNNRTSIQQHRSEPVPDVPVEVVVYMGINVTIAWIRCRSRQISFFYGVTIKWGTEPVMPVRLLLEAKAAHRRDRFDVVKGPQAGNAADGWHVDGRHANALLRP